VAEGCVSETVFVALPLLSVSTTSTVNKKVAVAEPLVLANMAMPIVATVVSIFSGTIVSRIGVPKAISDLDTTDAAGGEGTSEVLSEARATLDMGSNSETEAAPGAEDWILTVVFGTAIEGALAPPIRSALSLIAALVDLGQAAVTLVVADQRWSSMGVHQEM